MMRCCILLFLLCCIAACSSTASRQDARFGEALNNNLKAQKIQSSYPKQEHGQVTAQELSPSYEAYQQGKSVQSNSGEKLSTPMSGGGNGSQ